MIAAHKTKRPIQHPFFSHCGQVFANVFRCLTTMMATEVPTMEKGARGKYLELRKTDRQDQQRFEVRGLPPADFLVASVGKRVRQPGRGAREAPDWRDRWTGLIRWQAWFCAFGNIMFVELCGVFTRPQGPCVERVAA